MPSAALRRCEFLAARCLQDSAARHDYTAHVFGGEISYFVVYQAGISAVDAFDFKTVAYTSL